jgi:hypothetical protein
MKRFFGLALAILTAAAPAHSARPTATVTAHLAALPRSERPEALIRAYRGIIARMLEHESLRPAVSRMRDERAYFAPPPEAGSSVSILARSMAQLGSFASSDLLTAQRDALDLRLQQVLDELLREAIPADSVRVDNRERASRELRVPEPVRTIMLGDSMGWGLAITSDRRYAAAFPREPVLARTQDRILVADLEASGLQHEIRLAPEHRALPGYAPVISPGGTEIYFKGLGRSEIHVYDLVSGRHVRTLNAGPPDASVWTGGQIAISPDGARLALVENQALHLFDLNQWAEIYPAKEKPGAKKAEFSEDGSLLATLGNSNGEIQIYEARTGRPLGNPLPGSADSSHVSISAAQRTVTEWSSGYAPFRHRVWDLDSRTASPAHSPTHFDIGETHGALAPDGHHFIAWDARWDGQLSIQDLAAPGSGRRAHRTTRGAFEEVTYSSDRRTLQLWKTGIGQLELYDLPAMIGEMR